MSDKLYVFAAGSSKKLVVETSVVHHGRAFISSTEGLSGVHLPPSEFPAFFGALCDAAGIDSSERSRIADSLNKKAREEERLVSEPTDRIYQDTPSLEHADSEEAARAVIEAGYRKAS